MEMQQRELMDELEEGQQILNDSAEAEQAESSAKAAEAAAEIELARLEREEAALKKKKAAAADDWISRTRYTCQCFISLSQISFHITTFLFFFIFYRLHTQCNMISL
jgi:hypothetical protein